MATEKKINSRIQQKHDVAANWAKATNFIPKKGEIIIYEAEYNASGEETQAVRFKIGDGSKTVNNLPFAVIDYGSDIEALEQEVADNSTAIGKIQGAFESNSTTAKKATSAGTADKVANGLTLQGSGAYELNKITFDGSGQQSIAFGAGLLTVHANGEANQLYVDTEDSGVTPGTYNKVTVNKKGCVTTAENVDYAKKSDIPDVSGKANTEGGNTFKGEQGITRDDAGVLLNVTNAIGDSFFLIAQNASNPDGCIYIGMDTAQTPISFDGDFGLEGQALLSRGSGHTPMWGDITKHGYTQLTNERLSAIKEAGWYSAVANNTCADKPSAMGTDAFILIVEKEAANNIKQTCYKVVNTYNILASVYIRYISSTGGVSGWYPMTLVHSQSQTFSGRKTFSDGINLTGSLQINGSSGASGQVLTSNGDGVPVWKDMGGSAEVLSIAINGAEYTLFDKLNSGSFSGIFTTEVAEGGQFTLSLGWGGKYYVITPKTTSQSVSYKLTIDVNQKAYIMYAELTPLDGIASVNTKVIYSQLTAATSVTLSTTLDSSYVENNTGVLIAEEL